MPKVKRGAPELTSVPTRPSSRPSTIIAIAFSSEPCASTTAADQAEHHQREVFGRAELERERGERQARAAAMTSVATVPAKNEPSAAMASAGPARPCRAIW